MARIRSIKPSFAGDSKVARLTLPARLTFLLLLPECDDDGRLVASPKRLAGMLYPNDDAIGPKHVEKWIAELVREGMVVLYEHDGTRYLVIPKFRTHQSPQHPKPSVLPPPPDVSDSCGSHESVMTVERENHETVIPELSGVEMSGNGRGSMAPVPAQREPDVLWDATMTACRIDTSAIPQSSRAGYNKAVAELKRIGATPDEVHTRANHHRQHWPSVTTLTPHSLVKHWAELSQPPQTRMTETQGALLRAQARGR